MIILKCGNQTVCAGIPMRGALHFGRRLPRYACQRGPSILKLWLIEIYCTSFLMVYLTESLMLIACCK